MSKQLHKRVWTIAYVSQPLNKSINNVHAKVQVIYSKSQKRDAHDRWHPQNEPSAWLLRGSQKTRIITPPLRCFLMVADLHNPQVFIIGQHWSTVETPRCKLLLITITNHYFPYWLLLTIKATKAFLSHHQPLNQPVWILLITIDHHP